MNDSAAINVLYVRDFTKSPDTAATQRSLAKEKKLGDAGVQSATLNEKNWERLVWSRLEFIQNLGDGWDGTDSKPLDGFAAQFGMKLLQAFLPINAPAPQLTLLRYGGLQFEWFSDALEFELEIMGPYKVKAWFSDLTNDENVEGNFDYDYSKLSELFQKISRLNDVEVHAATAA